MPHIMIITGEPSGELHAAAVIRHLQQHCESLHISGTGGQRMQDLGVELITNIEHMTCFGFSAVLKQYHHLKKLLDNISHSWLDNRPDLLILVDFGGFNLKLAQRAKTAGIPVCYFIPPKVWAWGSGRIKKLADTVTQAAVILPFEQQIFAAASIPCQYVGNPSLEQVKHFLAHAPTHSTPNLTIGLLPGSRKHEIQQLLPLFLKTIEHLPKSLQQTKVKLSLANHIPEQWLAPLQQQLSSEQIEIVRDGLTVMHQSDVLLIASGTATLEAALLNKPMVVCYKVNWLNWLIWRLKRQQPWIALPNILLKKMVVPELINRGLTPKTLAHHLEQLLQQRHTISHELSTIRPILETSGHCSANTSKLILTMLQHLKTSE